MLQLKDIFITLPFSQGLVGSVHLHSLARDSAAHTRKEETWVMTQTIIEVPSPSG